MKKTSQKPASPNVPTMLRNGLISMPGRSIGTMKYEMPVYLLVSGSVRAMRMPNFATCASDVQIFWPLTTNTSPSRTARVERLARSDPASGSEKSWHHNSSPRSIGGR